MPICTSQHYWRSIGNGHYSAYYHYCLITSVPKDVTGSTAGNRYYSIGTIEGPLLD